MLTYEETIAITTPANDLILCFRTNSYIPIIMKANEVETKPKKAKW